MSDTAPRRPMHLPGRTYTPFRALVLGVLLLVAVGCGSGASSPAAGEPSATPSAATQGATTALPTPTATVVSPTPSAAGLPACLYKATFDLLMSIATATDPGNLVQANAPRLIAGLGGFTPPKKFDADYRDKVVKALTAADYPGALQLIIAGIGTRQWVLTSC